MSVAETRQRMSLAAKKRSEQTREQFAARIVGNTYFLGRKHTEESRAKMRLAQSKRPDRGQFVRAI